MARNPGIINTTQDAITDVARSGFEGARSIAGSAADTAAGVANSAALAVTGATLNAVRGARRLVGPAQSQGKEGEEEGGEGDVRRQAPPGKGEKDCAAEEEIRAGSVWGARIAVFCVVIATSLQHTGRHARA
jgi:hypothetical protein